MAELLIEDRGAVRTLTMNRPEKRNALNNALTEALLEGLRAADADDAVHAIVLTGAGPGFCAGADLSEFKDLTATNQPLVERRAQLTMSLHEIFPRLTKPVVSAINGPAIGGGAGLALAADIALMAESAQLAYPEVKHGIVAAIVMPNLVRQIGRKAAFELVATGPEDRCAPRARARDGEPRRARRGPDGRGAASSPASSPRSAGRRWRRRSSSSTR